MGRNLCWLENVRGLTGWARLSCIWRGSSRKERRTGHPRNTGTKQINEQHWQDMYIRKKRNRWHLHNSAMHAFRVLQVDQAVTGPKDLMEFQGHQVRMVAQVYRELQEFPSRFVTNVLSLLINDTDSISAICPTCSWIIHIYKCANYRHLLKIQLVFILKLNSAAVCEECKYKIIYNTFKSIATVTLYYIILYISWTGLHVLMVTTCTHCRVFILAQIKIVNFVLRMNVLLSDLCTWW